MSRTRRLVGGSTAVFVGLLMVGCGQNWVDMGVGPAGITNQSSAHLVFRTSGSKVQCTLDGQSFTPCQPSTSIDLSGLSDGCHTFVVQLLDPSNKVLASGARTWAVEVNPHPLTFTSQPLDFSIGGSATFAFTGPNDCSPRQFQCQLDQQSPSSCTPNTKMDYTGLTDGTHHFTVQAKDTLGNVTDAKSYTWTTYCTTPNLYVDAAHGSDGNPGTSDKPFKTITYALSKASSGQTLQVRPGTYDDVGNQEVFALVVPPGVCLLGDVANKGQGQTPTIIQGEGPDTVFFGNGTALRLNHGSVIAGFTVRSLDNAFGIEPAQDGAIIHSNTITSVNSLRGNGGIHVVLTKNHIIHSNVITGEATGILYESAHQGGGIAELNLVTGNIIGVGVEISSIADFGGGPPLDLGNGPTGSIGQNKLYCNRDCNLYFDDGANVASMAHNAWGHSPLTYEDLSVSNPTLGTSADICTEYGTYQVDTSDASVASTTCP